MTAFPFPTDLNLLLAWLAGPAAVGVITAVLLERIAPFHLLPPWAKALTTFALSLLLPLFAAFAQAHVTPSQLADGQIVTNLVLQGLVLWTGGQLAHGIDPQRLWPIVNTALRLISASQSGPQTVDWRALVKAAAEVEAELAKPQTTPETAP